MTKATKEGILNEIAGDFNFYLRRGAHFNSFSRKVDPKLNINNIEKLLRIHFVLKEEVIDFTEKLSERMRSIRTATTKETKTHKNTIRGRIDWQKTICQRYSENPEDRTLYVCTTPRENYDITENIVLKKLLHTIYEIVTTDLKPAIDNDYRWIGEWTEKKRIKKILAEVYLKNVYISRIDKEIPVTDRMISSAEKSRQPLYREAASLLRAYRHLIEYELNTNETKELLKNTFIRPEKTEVLFEMYWAIKLLKGYDLIHGDIKFNIIDETQNSPVAEWVTGDYVYQLFHDSTGNLQFNENINSVGESKDGYITREVTALKKLVELTPKIFGRGTAGTLWGGRPDILIEKRSLKTRRIEKIMICEVKYTDNTDYAIKGLRELLEYMTLVKCKDGEYFEEKDKIFDSERISGCLFLDEVKVNNADIPSKIAVKTFENQIEQELLI